MKTFALILFLSIGSVSVTASVETCEQECEQSGADMAAATGCVP